MHEKGIMKTNLVTESFNKSITPEYFANKLNSLKLLAWSIQSTFNPIYMCIQFQNRSKNHVINFIFISKVVVVSSWLTHNYLIFLGIEWLIDVEWYEMSRTERTCSQLWSIWFRNFPNIIYKFILHAVFQVIFCQLWMTTALVN